MAEAKKTTKIEWYTEIRTIVEGSDSDNKEDVLKFIDSQITMLEERAAKAKANAEKKKADGDALRDAVFAVLTDEFQTIEQITEQVEVEGVEVTKARVTSRLTALAKAEKATKDIVKDEGSSRKVTAYKLA